MASELWELACDANQGNLPSISGNPKMPTNAHSGAASSGGVVGYGIRLWVSAEAALPHFCAAVRRPAHPKRERMHFLQPAWACSADIMLARSHLEQQCALSLWYI